MAASFARTSWTFRWNTPRSSASIASTNTMNPIQNQIFVAIMRRVWGGAAERIGNGCHFRNHVHRPTVQDIPPRECWMISRLRIGTLRTFAVIGIISVASGATTPRWAAVPGMTFQLKVTLRDVSSSGRSGTLTLLGHGAFGGGHGRVDIDSTEGR